MHIVSDEDTYPEVLGMLIHALALLDPLVVFFFVQYLLPYITGQNLLQHDGFLREFPESNSECG